MSPELYPIVTGLMISIASRMRIEPSFECPHILFPVDCIPYPGCSCGKVLHGIISSMQAGNLLQQIGMIGALDSCLGIVMGKAGAITLINPRVVTFFGASHSILSMSFIGLIVGISVFCDSALIILSRLIQAIAVQASPKDAFAGFTVITPLQRLTGVTTTIILYLVS